METPDELCTACSKIDLFSLFTGPRYFPGDGFEYNVSIPLGTLAEVNANIRCPFCRLLHHDLYDTGYSNYWLEEGHTFDTLKARVHVHPIRADYDEEMRYTNEKTRDMVATKLKLRLHPIGELSEREKDLILHHERGNGIQLLSPDIDPVRPLLNGFQATTSSKSLELLQKWVNTCIESHTFESEGGPCCRPNLHNTGSEYGIRVIDVEHRTIVEKNAEDIDYSALSYVWGNDDREDIKLHGQHGAKTDSIKSPSSELPSKIPKMVEDAILVCRKISIPYLWVDRYCIDQDNLVRKGLEIEGMGYRYLYAKITLIAGMGPEAGLLLDAGLLHASGPSDIGRLQRIETIQGRKYITALPSIGSQIRASQWVHRAWTMQEGQFAIRCAFFGGYDISFLCGSGQWRESLHSGRYGHEADISDLETACQGYNVLSWFSWLNTDSWDFADYSSLLESYSPRQLSFESDMLNAVTGCLNLIGDKKRVSFIHGLPTVDFHYALLWTNEYDRPREGFPSWSWAGWHSLQNSHDIYPLGSGTCSLIDDGHSNFKTVGPVCRDVELQGLYIELTERPHRNNKCSQRFADIRFPSYETDTLLTISSELAHFNLEIFPCDPAPRRVFQSPYLEVPHDFDSTIPSSTNTSWEPSSEYLTPLYRLRIRDDHDNIHTPHYPRWYDNWPPFLLSLPRTLRGETLSWLLKDGIELVMILEVRLLEGEDTLEPFHLVLCLGLDRRGEVARRCGVFCLPKEIWDRAGPKLGTIVLG